MFIPIVSGSMYFAVIIAWFSSRIFNGTSENIDYLVFVKRDRYSSVFAGP